MKLTYDKLSSGHILSIEEAENLMLEICKGNFNEYQIAYILGVFKARTMELKELIGFRNALLHLSIPLKLDKPCIDVCGTGGDNKNTFNISTLSAFVLAAAGIPVAKHGNFASTSISGSSDILKHFGYTFKTKEDEIKKELDTSNLCFIHAPNFHPALKNLVSVRKSLSTNTLFNLMGPLVNPANTKYKYVGVFSKEVARLYNYFLQSINTTYTIVHSIDGYDEISLTSKLLQISNTSEELIEKEDLAFETINADDISAGKSIQDAATIFTNVLQNKSTQAQMNVVLINSATAMKCYNQKSLEECIQLCKESIESKKAYNLFKTILN
ncbi:MAG: anthranilate phosphoribosyltransferase [Bacteroidetes bacterium]|nr:anthranilate phosphoribosyltransferase [Bacteroidota bacterium]